MALRKEIRENIHKFFDHNIDIDNRTLYIGGEIEEESAEKAIKGIHILETASTDQINIILNSPGGCWYNGMAIYDMITHCKSFVSIKVFGQASSAGSIILQSADERILSPYSSMYIHNGETGFIGDPQKFIAAANQEQKLLELMYKIYIDRAATAGITIHKNKMKKLCESDTYLSANEAVSFGLADKVL